MKRKLIFILIIFVILFGLVAWTPASPASMARPFITQECLVQAPAPADSGGVSINSPVPSCWLAEQLH